MSDQPWLRAADADRERVAAALREHYAAGRIDATELDHRLGAAYAARTYGDLAALTADLPDVGPAGAPPAGARPVARPEPTAPQPLPPRGVPAPMSRRVRDAVVPWATVSAVLTAIWLMTGANGGFWPMWVIVPWGLIMLVNLVAGGFGGSAGSREERRARRRGR